MPIAYHFLNADMTAGAGRERAWEIGETRSVSGPGRLCHWGYHSSPSWRDAFYYALGPVACLVEVSDPVRIEMDSNPGRKQVSLRRKLLAARDCTRELRLFACDCAERALGRERERGREPDMRCWAAIEVARRYAQSKANSVELKSAHDAAADVTSEAYEAYPTVDVALAARAAYGATYAPDPDAYAAYTASAAAYALAYATGTIDYDTKAAARDEVDWQRRRLAEYLDAVVTPPPVPA